MRGITMEKYYIVLNEFYNPKNRILGHPVIAQSEVTLNQVVICEYRKRPGDLLGMLYDHATKTYWYSNLNVETDRINTYCSSIEELIMKHGGKYRFSINKTSPLH